MKMQNTEMEFVTFEAQDVITTSRPLSTPLAYANAEILWMGIENFTSDPTYDMAVNVFGFEDGSALEDTIGTAGDNYYTIISAGRSNDGYGVGIDTNESFSSDFVETSGSPCFSDVRDLRAWLVNYVDNHQ